MNQLSFAICGLLRKYKKTTDDLAEACVFPENVIHDWRYGQNQVIAPGQITRLARAFATSPKDLRENHLSLLYSHLLDDCVGPAAPYITIEVQPRALKFISTHFRLTSRLRRSETDLQAIHRHIWYDKALQQTIRQIARPLKYKPLPTTPPEA